MLAHASALALLLGVALPATARAADTHQVKSEGAKAVVGDRGKASLVIEGKNGWHVNAEAPVSVKLSSGPGLTLDKPKLGRADAVEQTQDRARFDVGFTAAEAGARTIEAEANFVMCQATACKPVKEKLVLAVDVAAPAAAKAPAKPGRSARK